jgi:hypothetical protein
MERIKEFAQKLQIQNDQYRLILTMGAWTPKNDTKAIGDDCYAKWMNNYFSELARNKSSQCTDCIWIKPGKKETWGGNNVPKKFYNDFPEQFKKAVLGCTSKVIILNWHMRFSSAEGTNRPNASTGRGLTKELLTKLEQIVEAQGKTLKLVYTVHEHKNFKLEVTPDAIITVNKEVKEKIQNAVQCPIYVSAVPNLMKNSHTHIVDKILDCLGDMKYINTASAMAHLKLRSIPFSTQKAEMKNKLLSKIHHPEKKNGKGLLIFCPSARHGFDEKVLNELKIKVQIKVQQKFGQNFKIFLAGEGSSTYEQGIIEGVGRVDTLEVLSNARYAISFDAFGFRTNASAIINVIRSGFLVFTRRSNEINNNNDLIDRTLKLITMCEANEGFYHRMLEAQQSLYRILRTDVIGRKLDEIFSEISTNKLHSTQEKNEREEEKQSTDTDELSKRIEEMNLNEEQKDTEKTNKKLDGGGKSTGIMKYADGMSDVDIELNLRSIREGIRLQNKENMFYVSERVLNKENIVESIQDWVKNNSQKHFLSIVTLENEAGKKHALALHIQKSDNGLQIRMKDPLPYVIQEFGNEVEKLQQLLSSEFFGKVIISPTGKQDIKSPTCGDVSLHELVEIHECWTRSIKSSDKKEIMI